MKTCPRCKMTKEDACFGQRSGKQKEILRYYCRVCDNEKGTQWYQEHKEHAAFQVEKLWRKYRLAVLEKYGGKCFKCGFSDERALQIDHVHNDGYTERKSKSSLHVLRKALKDTEGRYQLLCANCNQIKEMGRRKWQLDPEKSSVSAPQEN